MPDAPLPIVSYTPPSPVSPGAVVDHTAPTAAAPGAVVSHTAPTAASPGAVVSHTPPTAAAPGVVVSHTPPTAAAPGVVVSHTPPTAASPGAVVDHTAPTAAAPGAVVSHTAPTSGKLVVGGTLSPDATGELLPVPGGFEVGLADEDAWSTDGQDTSPGSGEWTRCYANYLVVPATTLITEILPPGTPGLTAGADAESSDYIEVISGSPPSETSTRYWLFDNAGTPQWKTLADTTVIFQTAAAGTRLNVYAPGTLPKVVGAGKFAEWQGDATTARRWRLDHYTDGPPDGAWWGDGVSPAAATMTPYGDTTGTPEIELATGVDTPQPIIGV